jgi:Protein of unknown function (DUF2637)
MTGRRTYWGSAAGVLVLAAAAFTLSYDALHQLALNSQVRPGLAWLWPVVIAGTIVVALLTVLAANRTGSRTAGRLRGRTPAQAGRPPRTRAAPAGSSSTARCSFPRPGGLPGAAGGRATPTGAGLARAAGVSERYGQCLLAEFATDPTGTGRDNGQRPARIASQPQDPTATEGR